MTNEVDTRYTQERELSWLRFDERVLAEARDETVPLFERLKFAAIFTSNLDEFFMIRVGSISDMALSKEHHVDSKSGLTPNQQLQAICKAVPALYKQRDKIVSQLEKRLRACNICSLTVDELDGKERKQVERWFKDYAAPVLSPLVVDIHHPFPHLPSKSLTVVLTLRQGGERRFGLVPIPRALPAFYQLEERGLRYLLTEQIIMAFADTLFDNYQVEEKHVIAVTRNADISPEDEDYDVGEDFRAHMLKVLKKRSRLAPVRLEVQGSPSDELLDYLCPRLELTRDYVFVSKAPLSMGYVYALEGKLPPESAAALCYPKYTPQWPAWLHKGEKMIPQILRRDALLFYPYHSMEPFLRLVKEAANDPSVLSIKITIYRLASTAKLVEYLAAAAENGKDVTVLMELRARFDEQANIAWAQRLEEAGCTILYGFEHYKVHSKICLITRREKGRIQHITQIGTGNYNEKTAKLYTDLAVITADQRIGEDAAAFFRNLSLSNLHGEYHDLWVAPANFKQSILDYADQEIRKAQEGKDARIMVKCNSFTDKELIEKFVDASRAGVKIKLVIRGICCITPQIPGMTDNIQIVSIVGRFLEHSRIYAFGTGEDTRVFIASGDMMTRNTERRVEVACPIYDRGIRQRLLDMMDILLRDNVKAREQFSDGRYILRTPLNSPPLCAQEYFMKEALQPPAAPPAPKAPEKDPVHKLLGFFRRRF